jgi:N utilization substance protein A
VSNLDMNEAIRLLAQEKGMSEDDLLHVLVDALASAYKRRPGAADEVVVEVNPISMDFTFTAYDLDEDGTWVNERDDTPKKEELGRIAAQTFRQVMGQRIREVERDRKFEEYANREGDIVTGIIQQTDTRYTLLDLGRVEALLPQAEQVPYERPNPGDRSKAYIVEVRKTAKGPQIVVSRTHPGLIKRLFELEVPEIADGIVEIKACAREPGHRTKIAVWSNDHNVDPVGACVGARGARVRMVVNELRGEKIDIVPFSEDLADMVAKALSPAKVTQVNISDDGTAADVIVPDHQLSLAIGREGQNARLSARLTGVRVDIRSESQVAEGVPAGGYLEPHVEYAEGEWRENSESGEMEWHAADGSVLSQTEWVEQTEGVVADPAADDAGDDADQDAGEAAQAGSETTEDDAGEDAGDDAEEDAGEAAQAGSETTEDDAGEAAQAGSETTEDDAGEDAGEAVEAGSETTEDDAGEDAGEAVEAGSETTEDDAGDGDDEAQ